MYNKNETVVLGGIVMDVNKILEKKLAAKELRIAFAGEFSSGKSTLINALIYKDLLKHSSYETTVVTVQLCNVGKNDPRCRTIEVFYKDGTSAIGTMKDLLTLSTTSGTHGTVIKIEEICIYLHFIDTEVPIAFLDTPGLNSIADFHRHSAVASCISSHLCVYNLSRPYLAYTDIEFLKEIGKYQSKFVFCIGFLDSVTRDISERDPEVNKLYNQIKNLFPHYDFKIVRVSALKALAGRDKSIKKLYYGDEEEITPRDRENLIRESNISALETIIKEYIDNSVEIRLEATKLAMSSVLEEQAVTPEEELITDLSESQLESLGIDERYLMETELYLSKKYISKTREELLKALRTSQNPDIEGTNALLKKLVADYRSKVKMDIENARQELLDYIKKNEDEKRRIAHQKQNEEQFTTSIPYYNLSSFSNAVVTDNISEYFPDIPDTAAIRELFGDDSDIIIMPNNNKI